jgi:hypothetical protein
MDNRLWWVKLNTNFVGTSQWLSRVEGKRFVGGDGLLDSEELCIIRQMMLHSEHACIEKDEWLKIQCLVATIPKRA